MSTSSNPDFCVGISTAGHRIERLLEIIAVRKDLNFLIIHQLMDTPDLGFQFRSLPNCDYIASETRGLSVSRNLIIKNCNTKFVLISDDDVDWPKDLSETLGKVVHCSPDIGAIIGRAANTMGENFHNYPKNRGTKTWHDFGVSSIEIVLNVPLLREKDILFDENFGLGSEFPSGEELILLADIRKSSERVLFVDNIFAKHSEISSGDSLLHKPKIGIEKGAMIRRAFGFWPGLPYAIAFSLRAFFKPRMRYRIKFSWYLFHGFFLRKIASRQSIYS
jgi:hypothetical protein